MTVIQCNGWLALPFLLIGFVSCNYFDPNWINNPIEWSALRTECLFENATETGKIKFEGLDETSGLVASRKNPGVFYAIEDSLSAPDVYAINEMGDLLGNN